MKNPEIEKIIAEYQSGAIALEEANKRLFEAGCGFYLDPWKNELGHVQQGVAMLDSGTGTLGDVTYDGAADQQIIASETYSDLVISTTGTATVDGNLKAETTTNSSTLDVNGNFAGGNVTNTGSMTLSVSGDGTTFKAVSFDIV